MGDAVPKCEWRNNADDGNKQRGPPHPQQFPQVGFKPYVEEQDENADLREDLDGRFGADKRDPAAPQHERQQISQNDANQQLPQNGRLPHPLCHATARFGRDDEERKSKEDWADGAMFASTRRGGNIREARNKDERCSPRD